MYAIIAMRSWNRHALKIQARFAPSRTLVVREEGPSLFREERHE